MTLPYVYRLKDLLTGKRYIGCRVAEGCYPEELGASYFTSSEAVEPLFSTNPDRFEKQIIVTGDPEYVYKVETSLLKFYSAAESDEFYNMHNNDNLINPVKAATVTLIRRIGVHARNKDQMTRDSALMVSKHLKARTGMFSEENMKKSHDRQRELGVSIYSKGARSRGGVVSGNSAKLNKTGIHAFTKEQRSELGRKTLSVLYRCVECGLIAAAPHIGNHFKFSNHSGKEIIK